MDRVPPSTNDARVTAVAVVHELIANPPARATGDPGGSGKPSHTAIDKRPVRGRRPVGPLGLEGDVQCDTAHHGGVDQAVYAYADEDADWWAAELGRPIAAGLFGENLRTVGVDVNGAVIGERWRIGDELVLEVTSPRVPCVTFAQRMVEKHWVKRFADARRPGAYLRVVTPGTVAEGDMVVVEQVPAHGVTIADVFLGASPEAKALLAAAQEGRRDAGSA